MILITMLLATAVMPSCDITLPGDEMCADYCEGKCSFYNTTNGDSGKPQNITIYRLTPTDVRGIDSKNTGNSAGDMGFILQNRQVSQECAKGEITKGCFLANSTENVYGRFTVEIDGQYGPYYQCNPLYQNASNPFFCDEMCDNPPYCNTSYYPRKNGTFSWQGSTCFCETCERCNKSVGRAPNPYTFRNAPPPGWPNQCRGFNMLPYSEQSCFIGNATVFMNITNTERPESVEATMALACNACDNMVNGCTGWYSTDNVTAFLYKESNMTDISIADRTCIGVSYSRHKWTGVGVPIGGNWYSTLPEGECKDGMQLGDGGCTWKIVSTPFYINATCANDRVDAVVEKVGAPCFDTCEKPFNKSGTCYNDCFHNTIEGDPVYGTPPMKADDLIIPFEQSFNPGECPRI
eukprot:TRINITY_DN41_c4_g1_i1.p1 TRINITY_DN41_c4_g1~~TRINITY_DN41_c4_g1_i1.p1  ORF type:complete len:407 (+),score=77.54 TRINITY_DN41_c4_g1_i1:58-1278(+)